MMFRMTSAMLQTRQTKEALRATLKKRLASMTDSDREQQSREVTRKVLQSPLLLLDHLNFSREMNSFLNE